MRSRIIIILLVAVGAFGLWRGSALSQGNVSADCLNKQPLQYRSSGSFAGNDTSQVNCTVDYWICNQHYSKSRIVKNAAGACDSFTDSVVAGLPKEACCDCYPNCGVTDRQAQKDCCADVAQLKQQIRQLEDRVKELEYKLNGDDITLGSGASNIRIKNKKGDEGVSINSGGDIVIKSVGRSVTIASSGDISVKASGNLSLKGSRITQN